MKTKYRGYEIEVVREDNFDSGGTILECTITNTADGKQCFDAKYSGKYLIKDIVKSLKFNVDDELQKEHPWDD